MKVLVVEDDRKIKTEAIDDCLSSLGHISDWAQNQQEANGLLVGNDYNLILQDLQIPSRPGGKDLPEFGRNLLRQIRACKDRSVPVILMTAQYQHCVDLMTELQEIGIDGSIAKPFPASGRTLAVVIEEVLDKHRRFRARAANAAHDAPAQPFTGGVLAFYAERVELCGEVISTTSQKGYGWPILHLLREKNERGTFVRMDSVRLASALGSRVAQNTLIRAIKTLRERIAAVMKERAGLECGAEDVVANGGHGYHLREWIVVEETAPFGTVAADTAAGTADAKKTVEAVERFSERQRWILAQLASNVKLTRRDVEQQFAVGDRTAKRCLGELADAGLIEFDRAEYPGFYRLK